MRCNKCKNCIKLEVEKRLFTPQPYQLRQGQLVIEHRLFTLRDMNGKEYRASGKRLTCYSHTIIVRDGQFIGRFFCKYW